MPRATSSAVAMRPVGLRASACLNRSGLFSSIWLPDAALEVGVARARPVDPDHLAASL